MIKIKSMKKVLVAALALSLVMAPVVGTNAARSMGSSMGSGMGSSTNAPVSGNSAAGTTGTTSSSTSVSAAEAAEIPSTSSVVVNGQRIVTTLRGAYMSQQFSGTVVMTGRDTIAANYSLTAGEQPYIRIYDINAQNSPMAMASINTASGAVGGTLIGAVNIEIGKLSGGRFVLLEQGGAPITMVFSIPRSAVRRGYAYAMVCVRPGGAVEILPDQDTDPATITFTTSGGLGAYGMIMYPVA